MKHIRANYGNYFGITVAGYPGWLLSSRFLGLVCYLGLIIFLTFFFVLVGESEAHPDAIGNDGVASAEAYQNDLDYLKRKVPISTLKFLGVQIFSGKVSHLLIRSIFLINYLK